MVPAGGFEVSYAVPNLLPSVAQRAMDVAQDLSPKQQLNSSC